MRILALALITILIFGFKSQSLKNRDFRILSASSKTTYGGVAGSGSTTTYTIRLKARRGFEITSDSGFGIGRKSELYILQDSVTRVKTQRIKCGQIIDLQFSIQDEVLVGGGNFQMYLPGSDSCKAPIYTESGVAIRYGGGKNKLLAINRIEIKTPIYAP